MNVISPNNPLEEALNKLNLEGTLVLMNLLCQRSLWLQQEEAKKNLSVPKIIKPNTTIVT